MKWRVVLKTFARFLNIIRSHVSYFVTTMMREEDLERARRRIWSDNSDIAWSPNDDISNLKLRFFVPQFFKAVIGDHNNDSWIGPDNRIDIYIDNHAAPEWTFDDLWDDTTRKLPENIREHIGERPRFVDDEENLPIQAADFLAWWTRKGYEEGNVDSIIRDTFGAPPANQLISGVRLDFTEDQITENLICNLKESQAIRGLVNIYDSNVKPRANALDVYNFEKRQSLFEFLGKRLKSLRRDRR